MTRVLVTGDRGFVGTHLCRVLQQRGCEIVGIDLKDGLDILTADLPDVDRVFHLAAQTNAQLDDAVADAETNILGSVRIFERYRDRVVFASTSMVNYPVAPYALSKLAGEQYARYFGAAIVRFCNLFGDGGHSVIDKFRAADRITIYGSGEQLRSYAHIDKAVECMLAAQPGETIILRGAVRTVNEIAGAFPDKPVDRLPPRPLDVVYAPQVAA